MTGPYTPKPMDAARSSDDTMAVRDARIDGLRAEASEAVGYSANTLRAVASATGPPTPTSSPAGRSSATSSTPRNGARPPDVPPRLRADGDGASTATPRTPTAAVAAEVGAEDARVRALRSQVDSLGRELGVQQTELAKLEIALRNLEIAPGSSSSAATRASSATATTPRRPTSRCGSSRPRSRSGRGSPRRSTTARPRSSSNAIFQVEYIERVIDTDLRTARRRSCASCATCSGASSARSGRSSASSGRRSSTSSGWTARSPTPSAG